MGQCQLIMLTLICSMTYTLFAETKHHKQFIGIVLILVQCQSIVYDIQFRLVQGTEMFSEICLPNIDL